MDCPSCGRGNPSDRLECRYCEALLVDVFAELEDDIDERTDPISRVGLLEPAAPERITAYSHKIAATRYTGDLPRLFRFGNRYQILEKLGEGGMGRVYKALDLELDRPVALKTIRTEKGVGAEILSRFKQELVLARKVTHKNVIRIYDLGEAEGMKFFTMELVEGRSLRDELKERGRLPPKEAVSFLKQMLAGLTEAHSQGVVHRDLKPANVMVDGNGHLRIMDFGIARTADSATMTGTDEMMGTPDYISPEQVKGEHADAQSDLYSLGVILYEMLTGSLPFRGETALSKIVARIQVKPPAPRSLCPDIPAYLERIVLKLMDVDPDLRYKSAEEVLQDIEREQVDRSVLLRARKVIARHRGWLAAAFLIASVVLGAWQYSRGRVDAERTPAGDIVTLAILPFDNTTGAEDLEWMQIGLPDMLITDVAQTPKLRPVLPERIGEILADLGREEQTRFDGETLHVIAEAADVLYTLYGRFVQSQGRLRLDLTLRESASGVRIPIRVDGDADDVFTLVDSITERVTAELDVPSDNKPIRGISSSLDAFRAYQQGLGEVKNGAFQSAIPLFRRAVALDEDFAMAHARLAESYFQSGAEREAREAASVAVRLSTESGLPRHERYQIHAISARVNDDPETAVKSYRALAELYPKNPDIRYGLASSLETNGKVPESVEEYRKVLELAPNYGAALLGLGRMMVVEGRPTEAVPLLNEVIASEHFDGDAEALGMVHSILGVAHDDLGEHDKAVAHFRTSLDFRRQAEDERGVTTSLTNLASALRKLSRLEEARLYLEEALALARRMQNKTMESLVLIHIGNLLLDAGELDEALAHYRDSLDIEWDRKEHTELAGRLDAIALVLSQRGLLVDALVYLEQAQVHLQESSDLREMADNRWIYGVTQRARGDFEAAITAFLETVRLRQQLGTPAGIAEAQVAIADICTIQGRFDEAFQAIEAAREAIGTDGYIDPNVELANVAILLEVGDVSAAKEMLDPIDTTKLSRKQNLLHAVLSARLFRRLGKARAAVPLLREAMNGPRLEESTLRLSAEVELAMATLQQGDARSALDGLAATYRTLSQGRSRPLQAEATLVMADAATATGALRKGRELALETIALAERFEGRLILADAYSLLASIEDEEGQEEAARQAREKALESLRAAEARTPERYQLLLRRRFTPEVE